MIKYFMLIYFLSILIMVPSGFASTLPDTGQTVCYNFDGNTINCPSPGQSLYGQDANYNINPMSYTKLDDTGNALPDSATAWSMVKDNVTGLIWEVKTNKDGNKNITDPHDADNIYNWYNYISGTRSYADTSDFLRSLNKNRFGGFSDWRLPTVKELLTIYDYGISSTGLTINSLYFPNTIPSYYWSAEVNTNFFSPWVVSFCFGYNDTDIWNTGYFAYARAVRGDLNNILSMEQSTTSINRFINNGDGTVTDETTDLMWQQASADSPIGLEDALSYCENLTLAGYNDWRLPNKKELSSLLDYNQFTAIDVKFFPDTVADFYWTSTTYASKPNSQWRVNFDGGYDPMPYANDKGGSLSYVRAVRN